MTAPNLTNVNKSFGGVQVLKDVNREVEEGEIVVLFGPSGCGKSPLLRVIPGLDDSTSGEVRIDEQVVNLVPPSKRGIAMVFQSHALYPHLNVRGNMTLALKQEKQPKPLIEEGQELSFGFKREKSCHFDRDGLRLRWSNIQGASSSSSVEPVRCSATPDASTLSGSSGSVEKPSRRSCAQGSGEFRAREPGRAASSRRPARFGRLATADYGRVPRRHP